MKVTNCSSVNLKVKAVALLAPLILIFSGVACAADTKSGATIYQHHCQNCHGVSGQGDFPGMPDFSRGEGLFQPNSTLMNTIKRGKGVMPAFEGLLTDEEILDVIAYLRTLR